MKIKKIHIFIFLFIITTIFVGVSINNNILNDKNNKFYKISVILREENSSDLMILKQGIDQAAIDMNVEINFVTLLNTNDYIEQKKLIEKEIELGAQSIVLAPAHYSENIQFINETNKKKPIVLIETNIINNKDIPFISCNNYKMGKELGEEVLRNGNISGEVLILDTVDTINSVDERIEGFINVLKGSKNNYKIIEVPNDIETAEKEIKEAIKINNINTIVGFEPDELEVVGKIKKELEFKDENFKDIEVYGVGNTENIISLLEENVINSIAVQNEFNIGYLSIQTAVDILNKKEFKKSKINYNVINTRDMYSTENQRLLFPFVR